MRSACRSDQESGRSFPQTLIIDKANEFSRCLEKFDLPFEGEERKGLDRANLPRLSQPRPPLGLQSDADTTD